MGMIDLSNAQVKSIENNNDLFCFELSTPKRSFILASHTQNEREDCVEEIIQKNKMKRVIQFLQQNHLLFCTKDRSKKKKKMFKFPKKIKRRILIVIIQKISLFLLEDLRGSK